MAGSQTNHKNNFTVRLYPKGATNQIGFYSYTINAKTSSQALYLAIKRFYRKFPNIYIYRMRVYSVLSAKPKKIVINVN